MKQVNFSCKYVLMIWLACLLGMVSQPLKAQDITLNLSNVTVKEAIEVLSNAQNYSFVINSTEIDVKRVISVNAQSLPIEKVLDQIFVGQAVSYKINGRSIIVSKGVAPISQPVRQQEQSIQKERIAGLILDEFGEAVIGATVVLSNNVGVVSDINGEFELEAALPATVNISYIGYESQMVTYNDTRRKTITLTPSITAIDEVVVVGYGTQRKSNLTGAVSSISSKDLNLRPVISAANALQGADPSVNLAFGTGSPESGYSINIRGTVSINGGSPLILCDGVEMPLNMINANDIESVSILKDASASAIYGAKASAGVVLITTKSGGAKDKAKVSYNGRMGWTENTTSTDFIRTGYDYVTFANFYYAYNGVNMFLYEDEELQKLYDRRNDLVEHPDRPWVEVAPNGNYMYYGNFDWYGYFYNRIRPQTEHNLSITGGNDKVNYYVSGRYYDQDGIFKVVTDKYQDYSFRAKFDAKLNDWLKWSTNVSLNNNNYKYSGVSNYEMTIARLESNISPSFVPFNPDGTVMQYTNQLYANSPIGAGDGGYLTSGKGRNNKNRNMVSMVNGLELSLMKELRFNVNYGYTQNKNLYRYRGNSFEYSRSEGIIQEFTSGSIYDYYREVQSAPIRHLLDYYLTFDKTWNNAHNLKVVGGSQYETYRTVSTDTSMTNLSNDDLDSFSAVTPESVLSLSQTINAYKTLGFFGRVNYDYLSKYLVEFSARADGSSRFQENHRWGFFPSMSAGWRMSEEDFFAPAKDYVDNLKVRLSVGSLGNQQVDYYAYLQTITTDNLMNYTFDGNSKISNARITDPVSSGLTWETVTTYNVGLDMTFLRNRLNVSTDYYIRHTKDMLIQSLTLPDVYGANTPRENSADMRTNGWEVVTTWNDSFNLGSDRFSYSVQASLGDYQRTITKYENPNKLISDPYEGKKMGEIWGYHVEGLFKTDKEAAEYQKNIDDRTVNNRVYSSKVDGFLRAGDVRFADLNGDGIIGAGSGTVDDPGDRMVIGNTTPRYTYSFRLSGNWNNFDASIFFQGVGKRDWYPAYSASSQGANSFWGPYSFPSTSFVHVDFPNNAWTEDNRNAYFPRIRGYQSYSGGSLGTVNDRYLQRISYLRFKNLSLGYTIPLNKNILERIRIYVSGENLYYWSPLKKYNKTIDPELAISSSTYSNNTGSGYAYPRVYTVGVDITF